MQRTFVTFFMLYLPGEYFRAAVVSIAVLRKHTMEKYGKGGDFRDKRQQGAYAPRIITFNYSY
jgi:hypothetical protein